MLTPKKRLSKREITEDQLLTAYAKTESFYLQYKKYVNYAITGLVILVVGIFIYINNRRSNNENAALALAKVQSVYDGAVTSGIEAQYQQAINGVPEQGVQGLKTIVENYGGTASGELARLYLANSYYTLMQYDKALEQYEDLDLDDPLLDASGLGGSGACYQVKKEYDKAASRFEKAASIAPKTVVAQYLSHAAYCYGLAGQKEKAVSLFKQVKKDYPTSNQAREADRYISQFSA